MAKVKFYKINNSSLSSLPKVEGQIVFVQDTGALYIDKDSTNRVRIDGISYTNGEGITISEKTITNSGVRAIEEGATNGTISVNTNGTSTEVAVHGLGSMAYKSNVAASDITSGTLGVARGGTGASTFASGQALIGAGTGAITTKAIDTTSGGTNNSNSLITSGAVYSGLSGKLNTSLKGANNGLAELGADGKVPSSQLPSYVDDVLEYDTKSSFPATGETGKIYVATDTNLTYRWSGTAYVEISASLALGETSSTAYRGDRGKVAYDHSQVTSGNPHNVTKSDVGLGNVGNFKAVSTVANQGLSDTEKSNARTNIGAGTSNLTLGTSSSTAYRGDYGNTAYSHATDGSRLTTATSSGLYKVASTAQGHIASLTAVTKADITGLGIPGSDTNTTYTLGADTTNNKITLTPNSGTAQSITVPYATSAGNANSATNATNDKNGNDITTTYYKASNPNGYTTNTGTITKVQANGTDVASSGTANIPAATTSKYGVTKLSSATNSTSTSLAATASAVKAAYDLANGKLASGDIVVTQGQTSGATVGTIKVGSNAAITLYAPEPGAVNTQLSTPNQTYYLTGVQDIAASSGSQIYNTRMSNTFTGIKYQTSTSSEGGSLYVDDREVTLGLHYEIA